MKPIAEKLLKICMPLPLERGCIAASKEMLSINGIHIDDLLDLPREVYFGTVNQKMMRQDDLSVYTLKLYAFSKAGLENVIGKVRNI